MFLRLPMFFDIDLNGLKASEPSPSSEEPQPSWIIDLEAFLRDIFRKSAGLDTAIGPQGSPHGDPQDDAFWHTLFTVTFRLPRGSDPGAFLWMRGAIYLREADEYILFTSFKAHDIHSGSAPSYIKQLFEAMTSMEDAKQLFKCFGPQIHCGYVMYASRVATTRTTQMLYTPTLCFLHSPTDPRETTRRYYALHGATVLGDHSARANRLARKGAYAIKNYFLQCDIDLGLNVNSLLEKATFMDEKGMVQKLQPSPIDIEDDQTYEMISLYRQYYFWYTDVIRDYSLKISKPVFKERQQQIKDRLAGFEQHQRVIPTEHNLLSQPLRNLSQSESALRIDTIISRHQHGAEVYALNIALYQVNCPSGFLDRDSLWISC
jgi:hypothetical protein